MKMLTGLSMLSMTVALVVLLTGQLTAAEQLLSPGGTGSAEDIVRTPIGRAQSVGTDQKFAGLYRETQLLLIGGAVPSKREIVKELRSNEPGAKIGREIDKGGTVVRIESGDVEFCASQSGGRVFSCARGPLESGGSLRKGRGGSLAAARKSAKRGGGSSRSDAAPSQSSGEPALPGEGAASSGGGVLDRARGVGK